jgi:predicted Na+-dependent transporter
MNKYIIAACLGLCIICHPRVARADKTFKNYSSAPITVQSKFKQTLFSMVIPTSLGIVIGVCLTYPVRKRNKKVKELDSARIIREMTRRKG